MALTEFRRGDMVFDLRDGGPTGGEPVILLHGFPQDSTAWSAVTPLLHESGLRTICPDQRGYSPGARPAGRSAYVMGALVGDVLALLDAAGLDKAHVVGHDWGGAVAWSLAARAPERVRSLTVLSTPHPAAFVRSMLCSSQGLRSWYMAFFQLPVVPERLGSHDLASSLRTRGLPPESAQHYAERMSEQGAFTAALNWYRGIPLSLSSPTSVIRVPTTYVWGQRDFALGRVAAQLTERFVHAPYRFEVLDAGHWLPEKRPREVAGAVVARVRGT